MKESCPNAPDEVYSTYNSCGGETGEDPLFVTLPFEGGWELDSEPFGLETSGDLEFCASQWMSLDEGEF